jgi:hypothetical protein
MNSGRQFIPLAIFSLKKRKLMRSKLYIAVFFGILGLGLPAHSANLAQISQNPPTQTTFASYHQECLQRSRREGLANDIANDLCNCTIKKFQARYTLPQFRSLVQKSKTDKTAARTLTGIGEACFDEVLYEN